MCPHLGEVVKGKEQQGEETQRLVMDKEMVDTAGTGLWALQAFLVGSRNNQ